MDESINYCLLCKKASVQDVFITKDYFHTRESFEIRYCRACGIRYTYPQPNKEEIAKYYLTEKYYSHHARPRGLFSMVYQWVRQINVRHKAGLIHSFSAHKGDLLDVGCGSGTFLNVMKKAGWRCSGVEVNENARQYVQDGLKIDVHEAIDNIPDTSGQFDVITLWHVLEHFHTPGMVLQQLHKLLRRNGILIVAVPNYDSLDAKWFQSFWAAYDVPRHLYHFNNQSLTEVLQQNNFMIIEKRPVFPDVFYISYLSAKYKGIRFPLLYGLFAGLFFWLRTRSPQDASSIIFVVKKMQ
jgi:2-polyprenyl-3-methyl-5-hydroxy-6-metoxy-1,4-benzoquinol methylase